ncbi:MAG: YraN family protein [Opitutaceae bacterium]
MLREWLRRLAGRWLSARGDEVGARGERAAGDYLRRRKRCTIVRRNWRHGRDEIDLVCRDGDILVFVEVKTRAAHALVGGYHAVDTRKKRALLRASRAYIAQLAAKPRSFRFDVVEVEHIDGAITTLRHFENVPLWGKGYQPQAH